MASGLTLIFSVEKTYSFYLDAIKDLYLSMNSVTVSENLSEFQAHEIYQLGSEQLQTQMMLYDRLIKRYKNGLIESICYVDQGSQYMQEMYLNEIEVLKVLNEDMVQGVLSADAENYFRHERGVLLERSNALEKVLGHLNQENVKT